MIKVKLSAYHYYRIPRITYKRFQKNVLLEIQIGIAVVHLTNVMRIKEIVMMTVIVKVV